MIRCFSNCWLGTGTQSEWVCAQALWERVSVFYSSSLLYVSSADFQGQMLWGFLFSVEVSQAGEPDVGLRPLVPHRNLLGCDIPPTCGSSYWGRGSCLNWVSDPLTYLDVVFLYILSYIKSVQLVFMSFSAIVVLYVVVLLSMAEYEFRVFLLCHLDPHPPGLPFFFCRMISCYIDITHFAYLFIHQ